MNDPAARGHAAGKDRLLASLKRMEGDSKARTRARACVRRPDQRDERTEEMMAAVGGLLRCG